MSENTITARFTDEAGTAAVLRIPADQPVHGSWDGRMICSGTYGGPAVSPKYDRARITCPGCIEALECVAK